MTLGSYNKMEINKKIRISLRKQLKQKTSLLKLTGKID